MMEGAAKLSGPQHQLRRELQASSKPLHQQRELVCDLQLPQCASTVLCMFAVDLNMHLHPGDAEHYSYRACPASISAEVFRNPELKSMAAVLQDTTWYGTI